MRDDRLSFLLEMAMVSRFIDGDLRSKPLFWVREKKREMSTLVTLFLQFFFSDTFDEKSLAAVSQAPQKYVLEFGGRSHFFFGGKAERKLGVGKEGVGTRFPAKIFTSLLTP